MLLHEVIELPVAERGSEPAIIGEGVSSSYADLARRAAAQSIRLRDIGLSAGDRIAVIAQKSPDVIAAFLGAARAGIVYAPLDIQASPAYWAMVLKNLGISHVLSDVPGLAEQLDSVRVHDIALETGSGPYASEGGAPPAATGSPDDDAYILTTSGSTGRPKGVLLSHRNALAFVDWAAQETGLGPDDTLLSVAPFHFDLSVFDIYGGLSRGARIVLASPAATTFPGLLVEAIERHRVTVLYTVPTVLRILLETGAFADGAGKSLRTVIYAGEPFAARPLAQLMEALPKATVFNFFGPTETNVCLAHRFVGAPQPEKELPIGRPASDAKIRLVDDAGDPVANGEIGQIEVEGPTVMKGYLTADGFVPASRPYLTGDFAQQDADGVYYFRGRRDQQVKVRGLRVELGSVENALLSVNGVTEAVAFVTGTDLVAFVGGDPALDTRMLGKVCASSLSSGAMPHKIVALSKLPRLSNGKLDLAQLKAMAAERA
jgi:L-proline---[L-prolyl-carrier protein] ligase